MVNYTVDLSETINLNTDVIATVTRDPTIWKILIPWVLLALTLFLIFQYFLIKFIETLVLKECNWKFFLISIFSLIILILMIKFAIHYGPVDLLRPISSAFGIK